MPLSLVGSGSISGLASGVNGVGKVLQIVVSNFSTSTTVSSSTWADSGLSATITPSSSTSKILVIAVHAGIGKSVNDTGLGSRIVRGASTVLQTFGANDGITGVSTSNFIGSAVGIYLDSPSTTSATTYKTQINSSANVNGARFCDGSSSSSLLLVEVAA